MATVLKSITSFVNLPVGVPTSLPHGLLDAEGRGLTPDHIEDNNADVVITAADTVNVTVRNDGLAPVNVDVLCEYWHSENRALPPGQTDLPVQPFIPSSGAPQGPPLAHATSHELGGSDAIDGNHVGTTLTTLTDGANIAIDCDTDGTVWKVTLTGDGHNVGAPANATAGMTMVLIIEQGGVGSYTVNWNAVYLFPGGTPPTLSTAIGAVDVISGVYDGSDWLCAFNLDIQ